MIALIVLLMIVFVVGGFSYVVFQLRRIMRDWREEDRRGL